MTCRHGSTSIVCPICDVEDCHHYERIAELEQHLADCIREKNEALRHADAVEAENERLKQANVEAMALLSKRYREGLERAAEVVEKHCPNCGGQGFNVVRSRDGEPEQEQCQFCYEIGFPIAQAIRALMEKGDD